MTTPETQQEPDVRQIVSILFHNNPDLLHKSLVRVSKGNRAKAFELAKLSLSRYMIELTEHEFDWACAKMNDNVEFEWTS